jgi:hypothetical protein
MLMSAVVPRGMALHLARCTCSLGATSNPRSCLRPRETTSLRIGPVSIASRVVLNCLLTMCRACGTSLAASFTYFPFVDQGDLALDPHIAGIECNVSVVRPTCGSNDWLKLTCNTKNNRREHCRCAGLRQRIARSASMGVRSNACGMVALAIFVFFSGTADTLAISASDCKYLAPAHAHGAVESPCGMLSLPMDVVFAKYHAVGSQ